MAWKSLRFGVVGPENRRSSSYKIFTESGKGKSDVYISNRRLGGQLKISLHQSGRWHAAYTKDFFEENFEAKETVTGDRFVQKWECPQENVSGAIVAFAVIIPFSSANIADPNLETK